MHHDGWSLQEYHEWGDWTGQTPCAEMKGLLLGCGTALLKESPAEKRKAYQCGSPSSFSMNINHNVLIIALCDRANSKPVHTS